MHINTDGRNVPLKATLPQHYGEQKISPENKNSFGDFLLKQVTQKLEKVNHAQTNSSAMNAKLATNPNEVDIHDVVIASQKAQIVLDLTKTVLQRAVSAYQAITNLR